MKDLVWILWIMGFPVCSNISTYFLYRAKKLIGLPPTTESGYTLECIVSLVIYVWVWVKLV